MKNAVTVPQLPQTAGSIRWHVAGVPCLFVAGLCFRKVLVQARAAGAGDHNPMRAWVWS
jgi:hypothetical protein